jgi:hypothetical protein
LPNGDFQVWLLFGDNGGYSAAKDEWTRIRAWVSLKRSKKDFVAEAVTFHRLILSLKKDLSLESARDSWERVLPPKSAQNYPVRCLFLMICTSMVPDTKIVDIFEPIFQNNLVTVDWVLEQTEEGLRELLRPLGRQANSSKFVIASMTEIKKRHLKTLLHWFAHNYTTEFDGIVLWCKYYFLCIIFRKNYAHDTCVI